MNFLNPEAENRMLNSKVTMTIRRGDVFRHEVAGAGGWGDPLDREPAAVLKDVRNELISREHAADAYGVVIDPLTWHVDVTATDRLRAEIRTARGWTETPPVLWEDPLSRSSESAA
jgi:N-methylhydantoinase B